MKTADAMFVKNQYLELSKLGTRFNLSFSSQLVLSNKIIALDGLKKRLLVSDTRKTSNDPFVIDLNEVAAVTVKKSYGSINQGELTNKGIEEFLQRIELQFQFSNRNEMIVLPFYDRATDNERYRPVLDRNAKNWQMILSKMAGSQTHKDIKRRHGSKMLSCDC